jgi:hypothetical protein
MITSYVRCPASGGKVTQRTEMEFTWEFIVFLTNDPWTLADSFQTLPDLWKNSWRVSLVRNDDSY